MIVVIALLQDYVCKNHIRFFHRIPQQTSNSSSTSLVVCGTGALYPNCTIVENVSVGVCVCVCVFYVIHFCAC